LETSDVGVGPYYGDSPALAHTAAGSASLLLKARESSIGFAKLFSDDDAKRQMGGGCDRAIVAQMLYLEFGQSREAHLFLINSTGTSWYTGDGESGFENTAFAICDTIRLRQPRPTTICIGQAMGAPRHDLSRPAPRAHRAALPQRLNRVDQPRFPPLAVRQ